MWLKRRYPPGLFVIIILGVFLTIVLILRVQISIEKGRQTKPITYLFDQPVSVPVEASDEWLRGAVWIKPTMGVWSAAFSPDGEFIAVPMGFGVIGILRAQDGSLVRMLVGHRGWVDSLAFSPNGEFLASVESKMIRLWSLSTWETVKTFPCDSCGKAVFSPNGRLLAAGDKTTIRIWEIETDQEQAIPTGQGSYINSVEFSDDGQLIVSSGGTDGTIKAWRMSDRTELFTIKERTSSALKFSIGGSLLASATPDGVIKLWRLPEGNLVRTISAHRESSFAPLVLFSPRGDMLASSSGEGIIKLWSPEGRFLGRLNWENESILALAFSPDGEYLASLGATLKLWQLADRSLKLNLGGVSTSRSFIGNGITSLAFSPDGSVLASTSWYDHDGVKLWRIPEGSLVRALPTRGTDLAFSPDGQVLAVVEPQAITLWQVSDGRRVRSWEQHCSSVAFSPDGAIVTTSCAYRIAAWRISDGSTLFSLSDSALLGGKVAFSPDGQLLAVAKYAVKLYDARDGSEVRTLTDGRGYVRAYDDVTFSPDGQLVAASDSESGIKIWRVSDGQQVRSYKTDRLIGIQAIAFAPGGKTVAIAEQNVIKLWDIEDDQIVSTLHGHGGILVGFVKALAISPDGKYLASGGGDGLALWQLRTE